MNAAARRAIFGALQAANPAPTTELHYESPFELLVAVILSAQATDVSVNKATAKLFAVARTPAAMVALGEETIAVDTHIFRVCNRTGLAPGKTPRQVEEQLLRHTPPEFRRDAHHWLILHGRYVCKARKPDCPRCVIARWCEYRPKTAAV